MTTPPDMAIVDGVTSERRIGKSNYWIQTICEDPGPPPSWRVGIVQKPARPSKSKPPQTLIRLSSQNPLFTFEFEGQRYPLIIGKVATSRGGKMMIGGSRKVGATRSSILTWVADINVFEDAGKVLLRVSGRFRCPGNRSKLAKVSVRIPVVPYRPTVVADPLPGIQTVDVAALWVEQIRTGIAIIGDDPNTGACSVADGAFKIDPTPVDLHGKVSLHFVVAIQHADSIASVVDLVRAEAAVSIEQSSFGEIAEWISLIDAAERGITQLLDSRNCTQAGKERWYFRASGQYDFGPGYPFYSIESSPAIFRWSKFFKSEVASRTAQLTAHGVAADFAAFVGDTGTESNKGAFWDCATGIPGTLKFSAFNGESEYGIASNSRITFALLQLFAETQDPLFRQSSLNACHWLMLKQNSESYYDGVKVSAATGRFIAPRLAFDGVLAIRPLVAAFKVTSNEVFIKNAWKIANYVKTVLLGLGTAGCLNGTESDVCCPVTLCGVINSLLDLDAEAPNDDLRRVNNVFCDWLLLCNFNDQKHQCFNYDGAYSGLLECSSTALRLFAFTGKKSWFRLGATLAQRAASYGVSNWRFGDIATQYLLSLGAFIPGATIDHPSMTVTLSWFKYGPDQAAAPYYDVRDQDNNRVDFIPLVCRETNQTIVLISASNETTSINLIKRNQVNAVRIPVVDLVSNTHCSIELPLYPLPYNIGQYAVVRVDI